ncbi:polygalacturonase [Mucilaginibacter yixingensis]|uniref:Polygalacturonase n=1 Tax=Mucilaginibacter yixingensis TaxID=1295612 RepID=A0A2T5JCA2_9SPHI|nr:glycosyl hydrolase family 28 protein [Mucilaginibacter yixingensis]PTQ99393.1 polygalacturonase [Mucilaginibacter yixingensis]
MKKNLSLALLLLSSCLATGAMASVNSKPHQPKAAATAVAEKRYNIADHGAVGDGVTKNTEAIQRLIDKSAKEGGATLVIPKGVFVTGSIFLKQGVNLEFQEGSVLKGSPDINDYPKGMTRIEGHFEPWRSALINADGLQHVRITGKGTLDGSGKPFWLLFYSRRQADPKTTNLSVERPRLTFLQNCKDVKIDGIDYTNSGFWNLHIYKCQNVTVNNCRFVAPDGKVPDNHAPSSDGIDVDSSQDLTISNCYFSVGDDDIALKGSKGPMAMQDKDSPPVERIYIHDCVFEAGGGVMTCGSEATIVRNVKIERCTTSRTVCRLKLRPDTPQQYENISISDITLKDGAQIFNISPWLQYFDLKGQEPPKSVIRNVTVSNVKGSGGGLGMIVGHSLTTFGDITLKDSNVTLAKTDMRVGNIQTLKFENVTVNGQPMQAPATNVPTPEFKK